MPSKNPNHPRKGTTIKVDPIRSEKDIKAIKMMLASKPRDLAIFCLGINSALRASDLLNIQIGQVRCLQVGEAFEVREKKTGKRRFVVLNKVSHKAVQDYLSDRVGASDNAWLFESRKGGRIHVGTLHALVKSWCTALNMRGNFGSHTLRKTFGYHQRIRFGMGTALLMKIFNHKSEHQTLSYLGIEEREVREVQLNAI